MSDAGNEYERHQIESLLQSRAAAISRGVGLFLAPVSDLFYDIHVGAVLPAMQSSGLNKTEMIRVFGSESFLTEVCDWVLSAELFVADVTQCNADLMYVLGLCHGLRRCPILIATEATELPFNLDALRCVRFVPSKEGIFNLRENLERVIRIYLAATRPKGSSGG
jgi:hypothetical protein